jgi:hypothetical protein
MQKNRDGPANQCHRMDFYFGNTTVPFAMKAGGPFINSEESL